MPREWNRSDRRYKGGAPKTYWRGSIGKKARAALATMARETAQPGINSQEAEEAIVTQALLEKFQRREATRKETAMLTFISLLVGAEYGVQVPYAHTYTVSVVPDEECGGYYLTYCDGNMPPHATDHAATPAEAAASVAGVADLSGAYPIIED